VKSILYQPDGKTEIDNGDSLCLLAAGKSREKPLVVKTITVSRINFPEQRETTAAWQYICRKGFSRM
jgi:hypothetical protein